MRHRPSRERGGRPPFPTELMVRVLLIQQLFNLSDEQMEFQLLDRLSFQRFVGLRASSQIPDRTTIWTFKERLIQAGASESVFEAVNRQLSKHGYIARGGQMIDASIVQAPKQSLSKEEKTLVREDAMPIDWKPAKGHCKRSGRQRRRNQRLFEVPYRRTSSEFSSSCCASQPGARLECKQLASISAVASIGLLAPFPEMALARSPACSGRSANVGLRQWLPAALRCAASFAHCSEFVLARTNHYAVVGRCPTTAAAAPTQTPFTCKILSVIRIHSVFNSEPVKINISTRILCGKVE